LEAGKDYAKQKLTPILRAYQETVADYAGSSIGSDIMGSGELEKHFDDVINSHIHTYIRSSEGQLTKIIKDIPLEEMAASIEERMDRWFETRAALLAADETVRLQNASALEVWRLSGIRKKQWRTVGKNCPFCNSLEGKIIGIESNFLNAGEVLRVGNNSLKSWGSKMHPPIHRGCDCIIVPV